MIEKLTTIFTDEEQKWYIANFYIYLHYHPVNDFPIKLDDIFKLLGFANKGNAKRTLENNFIKEEDYKEVFLQKEKNLSGGRPTEEIVMNIETFKGLCMMARTEEGKKIRKYYSKLESIFNETIKEEQKNHQIQLENKTKEVELKEQMLLEKDKCINVLQNKEVVNVLYIGHNPVINNLMKIGITTNTSENDILVRRENHRSSNPDFDYLFTYETPNAKNIEKYGWY